MPAPSRFRRLLRQLEERGVLRVAGVYAAGTFLVLQVADLLLPALPLPDGAYNFLVLLALVGFIPAVAASWLFDVTEGGVARAPAGLDAYEQEPLPPRRRMRIFSVALIVTLVAVAGGLLAFRSLSGPPGDGRISLAVFPFTASMTPQWGEGVPDLLATSLDGTPALRVMDPWALWSLLREDRTAPADVPDPARAALIARDRGANRYLLGSVVELGDRIEVVARLYRTGREEPLTFRAGGPVADLAAVVDRLAIDVLASVAGEADPFYDSLQRNATSSPDALKAYIAARAAMRRGQVDSAVAAIDRAVALDSTFALAWVESVHVYSWAQSMRGQPYAGLFQRLARAEAFADSLNERNRLRLTATRAMVSTSGEEAAVALNRILEIDSTDIGAWTALSYSHSVYGWQYGAAPEEAVRAADRAVALDSSYVPALAARTWLAVALQDTASLRQLAHALESNADGSYLAGSTLDALRVLAAPDSALPTLGETLGRRGLADWVTPFRHLRVESPDRAEILLRAVAGIPDPQITRRAAGELFRLDLARGRIRLAARELASGSYRALGEDRTGERFLVAAMLTGVGDPEIAADCVATLASYVPPDSALAYFESRPVWWTAWLVGAYHAQLGDTTQARSWQATIAGLPAGGTSSDYRGALRADIDARLLSRQGDLAGAIAAAERAVTLWSIHSEMTFEALPDPLMRFHLGLLHKAAGDHEAARRLFMSLVPPSTWLGLLTGRAWYELGVLAEESGRMDAARRYYERALSLWEGGDDVIDPWRDPVRRALGRIVEQG